MRPVSKSTLLLFLLIYNFLDILSNSTVVNNNVSISENNNESLKKFLLSDFKTVNEWFHDNYMIINLDKCNYMCLGKNNDNDTFSFNEFNLIYRKKETILRIKVDQK